MGKKLIITESQFKLIAKNKIEEALGVPNNVISIAKDIVDVFLDQLSGKKYTDIQDNGDQVNMIFNYKVSGKINDLEISKVQFTLQTLSHKLADKFYLQGASISVPTKQYNVSNKTSFVYDKKDMFENTLLSLQIIIPKNIDNTYDFITKELIDRKSTLYSTISHELTHKYNDFKKGSQGLYSHSFYQSLNDFSINIPVVKEFTHNLYFVHAIENITRPTEVAYELETNKVKRKEFYEFLKNNETYQTLNKIRNFSIEDFKNELKNNIDKIDELFQVNGVDVPNNDDAKIDKVMELIYINVFNHTLRNIKKQMISQEDIFSSLLSFLSNSKVQDNDEKTKELIFNQLKRKIEKFKNHRKFFEYCEKYFRFVGNKMIRKISKLYDMAQMNENSIINPYWNDIATGVYGKFDKELDKKL